MTNDLIEKFVESGKRQDRTINIHFKTRSKITGVFVTTGDYSEMKAKNFWRIVPESRVKQWQQSKDLSLSRLFNGAEFTRLTDD